MYHRASDASRGAHFRLRRPTRPDDTEAVSDLLQRARRILRAKLTALAAEHPRAEFAGGAFDPADGADRDGEGGPGAGRAAAAERARALAVLELAPGSTPDALVQRLLEALAALGAVRSDELSSDGALDQVAELTAQLESERLLQAEAARELETFLEEP